VCVCVCVCVSSTRSSPREQAYTPARCSARSHLQHSLLLCSKCILLRAALPHSAHGILAQPKILSKSSTGVAAHWSKRRSAKGRCFTIPSPAIPLRYTHNPHNDCSRQTSLEEHSPPCTMLSYLPGSEPVLLNYTPTGQLVPSLALDPLTKRRHAVRRDEGQLRDFHPHTRK
jgi:hypothetical protein